MVLAKSCLLSGEQAGSRGEVREIRLSMEGELGGGSTTVQARLKRKFAALQHQ